MTTVPGGDATNGLLRRSPRIADVWRFLLPLAAVGLTTGVNLWFDPVLTEIEILATYIPAVVITSLAAGLGPALLAIGLSLGAGFSQPAASPISLQNIALFFIVGLTCAVSFEYQRRRSQKLAAELAASRDSLAKQLAGAAQIETAIEQAGVGIARVSADGAWLSFNDRLCEIAGYPREELARLGPGKITHPQDADVDQGKARELALGSRPFYTAERRVMRRDQTVAWTRQTLSAVDNGRGRPGEFIMLLQDDTARRAVEAALSTRTAELEALLNTVPAAILLSYDPLTRHAAANAVARELFELEPVDGSALAELETLPLRGAFLYRTDGHHIQPEERPLQRAAQGERVTGEEVEVRFREGRSAHLLVNAAPVLDAQGGIKGAVAVCVDISARKQAEASLKESEERFHITVDAVPELIFIQRSDAYCEYVNLRYCEFTGLSAEAAEGVGWQQTIHPDDMQPLRASWAEAIRKEQPWECRHRVRRSDGRYRWFMGRAQPWRDESGTIVRWLGVLTDVHDLVEMTAALDRQALQLRLALDAGGLGTWELDPDSRQISGTDAFWANFSLPAQTAMRLEELLQHVYAEDREALRSTLLQAQDRSTEFEAEFRVGSEPAKARWINMRGRREDCDGAVRILGISSDRTLSHQAEKARMGEAHRDIIINELRHRIGNLFPVILSVVRLTAQHYDDVPSYQRALVQRLAALQVTHDLLVRELAEEALVEELVLLEISPYEAEERVSVEGPPLRLTGGNAESFAMIVHELATNSVKHGALSVANGKLDIRWHLERRDGATSKLVFEWTETSGPEFEAGDRRGYGSFIVGLTGAPIIGESAVLEPLADGLRYRLVLPYDEPRYGSSASMSNAEISFGPRPSSS